MKQVANKLIKPTIKSFEGKNVELDISEKQLENFVNSFFISCDFGHSLFQIAQTLQTSGKLDQNENF